MTDIEHLRECLYMLRAYIRSRYADCSSDVHPAQRDDYHREIELVEAGLSILRKMESDPTCPHCGFSDVPPVNGVCRECGAETGCTDGVS